MFQKWLIAQTGDPLAMLRAMKIRNRRVYFRSTTTLSILSSRLIRHGPSQHRSPPPVSFSRLHPDVGSFRLAPGAHAALPLDIMSEQEGLVGAEVFAAVWPHRNGKLEKDLDKLKDRPEKHRYVFFMSPLFPGNKRQFELERDEIQVWSVDV